MKRLPFPSLLLLVGAVLLTTLARPASGGGPLAVTNGTTPIPIIWRQTTSPFNPSSSIPYNPDLGTLGAQSQAAAQAIVAEMFQVWQDVPTSVAAYTNGGSLPVDVNSGNYTTYLDNASDTYNPIVFDTDGSIHDAVFGAGNTVLGFAGFVSYFPSFGGIYQGQACLNGKWIDGNTANGEVDNLDVFKGTFLHEFGHYSGLDHSQINNTEAWDGDTSNDDAIPTMFPVNVFQTASSTERLKLNADDIQIISSLYPDTSFATSFGKITGTVFSASGVSLQGVNVVARNVNDPTKTACSSVSGFLFQESTNGTASSSFGTTNTLYRGTFEIAVTPGNYTLEIEPIDGRFRSGSVVGPISPPIHAGPREYWNGYFERETYSYDNPSESTVIPVAAGQTVSQVNFMVNYATGMHEAGSGSTFDLANTQLIFTPDWTAPGGYRTRILTGVGSFPISASGHTAYAMADNGSVTFNNPLTVYSPFYAQTYVSLNVAANGLITFGATSAAESDTTPTLAEFYGGGTKIAPFWTDLDPSQSGFVRVAFFTTGVCITYDRVQGRAANEQINCQVFIDEATGVITMTYLSCNVSSARIVGISSGGTYQASPSLQRDFSSLGNDTTAPSVAITAPADRAVISGTAYVVSATTSDPAPSSGTPTLTYYLDGIFAAEGVGSFSWDTTRYSNGEHRVIVVSRDGAGNSTERAVVVYIANAGGIAIGQQLHSYSYSAPTLSAKLEIKNNSTQTLTGVRVNQIYLEVTGSFTGTKRAYGSPASNAVFPAQVAASLAPGQSITIPVVFAIPTGGTNVARWVNEGFCDQLEHF